MTTAKDEVLNEDKTKSTKCNNEVAKIDINDLPSTTLDDIDDVFLKLEGTIFQFKTCLFRITAIDKDEKQFTSELLNAPKD
jgi:hypothetical protein